MPNVTLRAPTPIRYYLDREPDILGIVKSFIRGEYPADYLIVAGPPTREDHAKAVANRKFAKEVEKRLPTITFRFKMVKDAILIGPAIEVTCSDEDLGRIKDWNFQYQAKHPVMGVSYA